MTVAKIRFRLGQIQFFGEGDEKWVGVQLDKILEKATALQRNGDANDEDTSKRNGQEQAKPPANSTTLASFLQQKNATSNQVKRFLATAEWLTSRGSAKVSTSDVTKALKANHQGRLSNPAHCLNKNVAKGYCEKDGKQFFVTPEGRSSLG